MPPARLDWFLEFWSSSNMAMAMGNELLMEAQYHELQKLGEFDLKTSSWLSTPPEIRKLGGALYYERRYDRIFAGHNGTHSRGFRGSRRA